METIPAPFASTDTALRLDPHHGGKRIDFSTTGTPSGRSLVWSNGTWSAGPTGQWQPWGEGGTARSMFLRSHDLDSLLLLVPPLSVSPGVQVGHLAGQTQVRGTTIWTPPLQDSLDGELLTAAYPMQGSKAIVVANRFPSLSQTPRFAALYRVDLGHPNLQTDTIAVMPDTAIMDVAFSEDGTEKVMKLLIGATTCRVTWSRSGFGTTPATRLFDSTSARRVETLPLGSCGIGFVRGLWDGSGQGTVSPRIPGAPQVVPRTKRPASRSGKAGT